MPGDDEQYLSDRLDQVQKAMRQGDADDVVRQVGHVRGESDSQTADTLLRLALDRELKQSRKRIRIWMAVAIVLAVGAAITITVVLPRTRLGTLADTAPTTTPATASTAPVPVGTPSAPNSSLAPPVPAGDGSNLTVLHDLTDFTLGGTFCSTSIEGTLDIDELAPNYENATITNCANDFRLSYGGKYIAEAPLTQPTAQACETQAKRGSQTRWNIDDVKAGEFAVCTTSKKNNVAWIKVVDKGPRGKLTLQVIVWKPAPR
ncbi:hypothetical protein [Lentzea cavernae]|uniref:hypothetical protein n=1 Tax=Lentzea cavernae TaxID=2020703 RepID=UPI001748EFD5|nr:hypothetical protein [Lentzea cavernae]